MKTRFRVLAVAVLATVCSATLASRAEEYGQPIYPAYQGWAQNPDGSFLMVFQYFSRGRDTVTVPVGDQNHFNGEADRNQPISFQPGNHEFVCVMVVPDAATLAATRWTVSFPKEESATTIDPTNREYRLEQRSEDEARRDVDLDKAPRNVCLNKPPDVTPASSRTFGGPPVTALDAAVGKPLVLAGTVRDEGLPRGSTVEIQWRQVSGPGKVAFTDAHQAATKATFDKEGTYEIELWASDGELEKAGRLTITVKAAGEATDGTKG